MSYKVAIIEDNEDLLQLYKESFEDISDEISCASFKDGNSALEELNDHRYDLIICDLMLPDIHGLELIKKLRKNSANVSSLIFIVSGSIDEEVFQLVEGFHDIKVFEKPIADILKFGKECFDTLKTRKELSYDPEILETIRESAFELLSNYFEKEPIIGRCQLSPLNIAKDSLRGFITFTGKDFDGTLAVDLGQGFIDSFGKKVEIASDFKPSDIAYEMANELAGQFKASILKKGYEVNLGIPAAMTLEEVEKLRPKGTDLVYIPAGYIGSLFRIEFSMSIPDFSHTEKEEAKDSLEGGQVFLFD